VNRLRLLANLSIDNSIEISDSETVPIIEEVSNHLKTLSGLEESELKGI
jgi:hypothetical protein